MNSRPLLIAAGCVAAVLTAMTAVAVAQPDKLPIDKETTINGVPVACTGVGQTRFDPRWQAYPVRVEFSNAASEYLTDAELTVSGPRGPVLTVVCGGPWVLMKLPAGSYTVQGRILGAAAKPRTMTVRPPASGQARFVMQFSDL